MGTSRTVSSSQRGWRRGGGVCVGGRGTDYRISCAACGWIPVSEARRKVDAEPVSTPMAFSRTMRAAARVIIALLTWNGRR